jgi:large subunit ribosomal protein L14
MIIPGSLIRIVDNSGGKICRCIRVLSKSHDSKVGDLAVVSLIKVRPRVVHKGKKKEQLKKGDIRLALIIQNKRDIYRKDGTILKAFNNFCVLVTTKGKALGSRYKASVPKELRSEKWLKVVSMAPAMF